MAKKTVSGSLSIASLNLPTDPGPEATIEARLDYADTVAKKTGLALFVTVGRIYQAIKDDHSGVFVEVINARAKNKRGLAIRSIQQFMKIAETYGPILDKNPSAVDSLPTDRTTLATLASADTVTLETKLESGEIHAGMKRDEARQAVADGESTIVVKTPVEKLVARFEKLDTAVERAQFLKEAQKAHRRLTAEEKKAKAKTA